MNKNIWLLGCLLTLSIGLRAQGPLPSIEEKTSGMEAFPGFLAYFYEAESGKVWLRIDNWEQEFLYQNSLPAGVGSNDIGLDRGKLGKTAVLRFWRSGPKVLLLQSNYDYRAITDDPDEREAVQDAFAQSVLGGFLVAARQGDTVLIDITDFLLRDGFGVAQTLKQAKQGSYKVDPSRSAVFFPACKNFPQNTELEAMLTFSGTPEGSYIREVAPDAEAVTVRQRHAFIALPDAGYTPRPLDPRGGFFGIRYQDYATPISASLVKRFIVRHRLEKKNPDAALSDPVAPIIYYVDRAAPEPIRSALIEGASWWNEAFEAAGYRNAFQVKVLPEGADPMDVRYNVIQWVHRRTRGWSYGSSVVDPRTGEILKGHVTLGSLRVRQDFLIAQGLVKAYESGQSPDPRMEAMALARLRQLAAHEVGHTLGLAHNFAASTAGRASVMDYPHPLLLLREDGQLDFSQAYDVGIGEWDKFAIRYGYQDFPSQVDEEAALQELLQASEIPFLSDEAARSWESAHPLAHLWDNGSDPVDELRRILAVRKAALGNFGKQNVPPGSPMSSLEEVLVPLYFAHRYQVEAVIKLVGGVNYGYEVRGAAEAGVSPVAAKQQQAALEGVLETLKPENLAIPESILTLIPPKPSGFATGRESMPARTGFGLDPLAAAEAYVNQVMGLLLVPARANRLLQQAALEEGLPGLEETFDALLAASWYAKPDARPYFQELERVRDRQLLLHMMQLSIEQGAAAQVRALTWMKLEQLATWLSENSSQGDASRQAHLRFHLLEINRFLQNPQAVDLPAAPPMPDGSPIGCGLMSE